MGRLGVPSAALDGLRVEAEAPDQSGLTHLRYEQHIDGMRVHGAYAKAAIAADGSLVHMIDRVARLRGEPSPAGITPAAAMEVAITRNFGAAAPRATPIEDGEFVSNSADSSFFHRPPTVERVVIAEGERGAVGFLVETWSEADNLLYHTLVDGAGRVVENELRTANDRFRVFAIHPGLGGQSIQSSPNSSTTCGSGSTSPSPTWRRGSTQNSRWIRGCNADAYLDRNANNAPDGGGAVVNNGDFLSVWNGSQAPGAGANPDVAVQNLFYHNNFMHDQLYRRGFREADGNFQYENGSRGGKERDPVNAEALDGSGFNNANFATPKDGSRPRMQMYIWTAANPDRDSALDADVIYHEYGHGLTWRLVDGMSGTVAGALGEGMSDALAFLYTNDDRVGEYSAANSTGIRSKRYGQHTETLADFSASRGVHRNGEIYAATIWRLKTLYEQDGHSRDTLMNDIVAGLKLTPSTPTYIQMRDGLLSGTPSSRDCLVWEAFAAKGMGSGASMNSAGTVSASSTNPCAGPPVVAKNDVSTAFGQGNYISHSVSVLSNDTGGPLTISSVTSQSSGVSVVKSGSQLRFSGNVNGRRTWRASYTARNSSGSTDSASVTVILEPLMCGDLLC